MRYSMFYSIVRLLSILAPSSQSTGFMESHPHPLHLPPLPQPHPSQQWPTTVQKAFAVVSEAYDKANQLLRLEDGDPIRLRLHSERLTRRILPLLHDLTDKVQNNLWASECVKAVELTIQELNHAATSADNVYVFSCF